MPVNVPKFALVTGGGSGIGRAICLELASAGWTVAVADVDGPSGLETAGMVTAAGGRGEFEQLDVTQESEWLALRERLQQRWPGIDLVVNNAGVCAGGELTSTCISTWDWVHEINLRGAMLGCRTFIPWLKSSARGGNIMNMSSIAGLVFAPRMAVYNSTKAALVALSETLHLELMPYNVGVTAVCPWFIPTNLLKTGRFAEKSEAEYAASQMRESTVTPQRVAKVALSATFRRRAVCVIGRRASFFAFLKRMFPNLMLRLIGMWSKSVAKEETVVVAKVVEGSEPADPVPTP